MSKASALQKGLRIIKTLRGHTLDGLSNLQISQATGLGASTVTRTLQDLIAEGFAEKRDDGRFCLSISALQIAQAHALEMQKAQDKINEINRRVAAGARQ